MRISLFLIIWFSKTRANDYCEDVIHQCKQGHVPWTRCFEDRIATCRTRGRFSSNFVRLMVNPSQEAEAVLLHYRVNIPSSALQRSRGAASEELVLLVATVINSTFFELSPHPGRGRGRAGVPAQPAHRPGTIMEESVLAVRAGNSPVKHLQQPIRLTFRHNEQVKDGTCVFWEESGLADGTGHWSTDGCNTTDTGSEFICSCNHLSFFAVLVNPVLSVEKSNAVALSYITYVGSALSVFFTVISFIIYACLKRPEKVIRVHMQLTVALLCLHLSFLLCSLWVQLLVEDEEGWACRLLGLSLHWSLLATFSWTALEGFHLYLLLVRVFNVYVRRYLLKLSLVGWGFPTVTVVVCGILGVYGKYSLELRDGDRHNSTVQMCWMSSQFPQRLSVSYITTVALPCLVILHNSCMLGLVVLKLWGVRCGHGGSGTSDRKMNREAASRLWKDCATVLGLSCVLGLPWGLMSTTYISLPGIYVFTVTNSLQGLFMFLWALALSRKSDSDSSARDTSSQKMMTTSFNS